MKRKYGGNAMHLFTDTERLSFYWHQLTPISDWWCWWQIWSMKIYQNLLLFHRHKYKSVKVCSLDTENLPIELKDVLTDKHKLYGFSFQPTSSFDQDQSTIWLTYHRDADLMN